MSTSDDRPPAGQPEPPRWDAPPQPPVWDRPTEQQQNWGPPPQYGQGGGQYPPAGYGQYAPAQTEGKAVAALVLSICSWVVLPFIAAIIALVLAGSAKRDIEASGGRLGGAGMVTAAKWVSWLNIGFCLLLVLLAVLALGLFATSVSTSP